MKKIDGLRIDYEAGIGDIALPLEFSGQPVGLKVSVLMSWIAALLRERDKAAQKLAPAVRAAQREQNNVFSIEQLLSAGLSIISIGSDSAGERKALFCIATIHPAQPRKQQVYESVPGSGGYRLIFEKEMSNPSFKNVKRAATGYLADWQEYIQAINDESKTKTIGITYASFVNAKRTSEIDE